MAIRPCSVHGGRFNGRAANVYAAWFNADQRRTCYLQRLCADCFRSEWVPILTALSDADTTALAWCPVCHTETQPAELDPIYLTIYLPKREPLEFGIQTHAVCAVKVRGPVVESGERQPDRNGGGGNGTPNPDDDWGLPT